MSWAWILVMIATIVALISGVLATRTSLKG